MRHQRELRECLGPPATVRGTAGRVDGHRGKILTDSEREGKGANRLSPKLAASSRDRSPEQSSRSVRAAGSGSIARATAGERVDPDGLGDPPPCSAWIPRVVVIVVAAPTRRPGRRRHRRSLPHGPRPRPNRASRGTTTPGRRGGTPSRASFSVVPRRGAGYRRGPSPARRRVT